VRSCLCLLRGKGHNAAVGDDARRAGAAAVGQWHAGMMRAFKVLTQVVALTYKNRLIDAQKRQVRAMGDERGGSCSGETVVRVGVLLVFSEHGTPPRCRLALLPLPLRPATSFA
jgi:hypothetical protein